MNYISLTGAVSIPKIEQLRYNRKVYVVFPNFTPPSH